MALEQYLQDFNIRDRVIVPHHVNLGIDKIVDDKDEKFLLRVEIPRKNRPVHSIFFYYENDRFGATLNDEKMDLGFVCLAAGMRISKLLTNYTGSKLFLVDSYNKTEEELKQTQ